MTICLGHTASGQTAPQPLEQPDPTEIPIGTEANAIEERPFGKRPLARLPASMEFRIATWNLAARRPGDTSKKTEQAQPVTKKWRHTFGAERKTAQWRKIDNGDFGADIIALQGVTGRQTIGRLFHARYFQVLLSRQLLEKWTTTSGAFALYRDDAPPTTAVIFRRRRGVRISGFQHFLPKSGYQQQSNLPAAITAVRLSVYRQMLWIASADLPTECDGDATDRPCGVQNRMLSEFLDWASKQLPRQKTALLLLGRWPKTLETKLAGTGLTIKSSATSRVECAQASSTFSLIGTQPTSIGSQKLENPHVARTNPCVATANLELSLANKTAQ